MQAVQQLRVLGLYRSIKHRVPVLKVSVASADCSDGVLSIDALTTLLYHRVADTVPGIGSSPMREQDFIYLKQGLLVVHEQLKQMVFVLVGKVLDLDAVLCQLCQFQQTLLELACFLRVLFNLLVLLLIHYFVFQAALHDTFTNFFDALHKEGFKFILLRHLVDSIEIEFFAFLALLVK